MNLVGFFAMGRRDILLPSPRPPSNLKRAFENYPIRWLTGVNTLFNALLNERWFVEHPPRALRASAAGGMALVQEGAIELFHPGQLRTSGENASGGILAATLVSLLDVAQRRPTPR